MMRTWWCGRPIEELTREELIEALQAAGHMLSVHQEPDIAQAIAKAMAARAMPFKAQG
jgi:hypothetical protein